MTRRLELSGFLFKEALKKMELSHDFTLKVFHFSTLASKSGLIFTVTFKLPIPYLNDMSVKHESILFQGNVNWKVGQECFDVEKMVAEE